MPQDPLAHSMGFPPRPGEFEWERSAPSCFIKGIPPRRILPVCHIEIGPASAPQAVIAVFLVPFFRGLPDFRRTLPLVLAEHFVVKVLHAQAGLISWGAWCRSGSAARPIP